MGYQHQMCDLQFGWYCFSSAFPPQSSEGSSATSPIDKEHDSPRLESSPSESGESLQSTPQSPKSPSTSASSKIPRFKPAPAARGTPPRVLPRGSSTDVPNPRASSTDGSGAKLSTSFDTPEVFEEEKLINNDKEILIDYPNTAENEKPTPAPRPKSKIPNPFNSNRDEDKVPRSTNPFVKIPENDPPPVSTNLFTKPASEPASNANPFVSKIPSISNTLPVKSTNQSADKNLSHDQNKPMKTTNASNDVSKPSGIPRPGTLIPTPSGSMIPTPARSTSSSQSTSALPSPGGRGIPVLKSTSALPQGTSALPVPTHRKDPSSQATPVVIVSCHIACPSFPFSWWAQFV